MAEENTDTRETPLETARARKRLLELFVLCGFAVAQPLLDVTGRSPETFLFYRVGGLEIVAYALLIVFVPPVLLWLVVRGVGLISARLASRVHIAVSGGLVGFVALEAIKKLADLPAAVVVAGGVAAAIAALTLFARVAVVRTFVGYLVPAPVVFALLFLLASPTAELVRPAEGAVAASGTEPAGSRPPVVVILLDEFPLVSLLDSTGQVDGRVYPNFAALAKTSSWFRNGTGVSSFTQYAVPAVLTGRYPRTEAAPSYVEHPDSLFSLLAPEYRIRPFETITQLCDPALCEEVQAPRTDTGLRGLFGQTWRVAKDLAKPYDSVTPISEQFAEETAAQQKQGRAARAAKGAKPGPGPNWKTLKANQPQRFQRFVAGLGATEEPTLHFLHLLMPHTPWRYLPSGTTYPDKLLGGVRRGWGPYAYPLEVNRQRHLLQVAYTDRLLGEVVSRMKSEGVWDEALVVVTADHGESFIPGTSGRRLIEDPEDEAQIAWVPVFIKEPGQSRGKQSDANWEQVDLLPTLADALQVELPFKVDGISHLTGTRTRTEKYFYNDPTKRIIFDGPRAFHYVRSGITDTLVRGANGQRGLYEMGPRRDWVGKRVRDLPSLGVDIEGPASPMSARVAREVDLDQVDLATGSVPALITGTLTRSSGRGPVVIAVNGTVAAVSEIWPEQGKPSFGGMASDSLFQSGKNSLSLYEIVGGARPQLRPIAIR